jgi:hypothetical protein
MEKDVDSIDSRSSHPPILLFIHRNIHLDAILLHSMSAPSLYQSMI